MTKKVVLFLIMAFAVATTFTSMEERPYLSKKVSIGKSSAKIAAGIVGAALPFSRFFLIAFGRYRFANSLKQVGVISLGSLVAVPTAISSAKFSGWFTDQVVALCSGLGFTVSKILRVYDINYEQYQLLIDAARKKNFELPKVYTDELYKQQFGQNWQPQLQDLLINDQDFAVYLCNQKKLSFKESCLVRMIELGAALDAIYNNQKPDKTKQVGCAFDFYYKLGFLKDGE